MRKKQRYYYNHLGDFRRELREAIPQDTLRRLHQNRPWKHFALVSRQIVLLLSAIVLVLCVESILIWLPCSIVIGFVVFDFTVLLHEVIHHAVFAKRTNKWYSVLGWLYAVPSGISRSQFTRWHLDHHDELGSETDDPKRAHLTPKIVKRWYKLLYMTPVLFPLYFRAAAKEASTYPLELQKTIAFERKITIATHLGIMALLITFGGGWLFLKLYAIPYFFVFPVAFTINRIGQHYCVNPNDVAQWSCLMKSHPAWNFIFLYSNLHLEHHYFPGVPCYHLPELQRELQPLYQRHAMRHHIYSEILWGWFVLNKTPHTSWETKP